MEFGVSISLEGQSEIELPKDLKSGAFSNVRVVGRAASYWSRKYEGGGWDGKSVVATAKPITDANYHQLLF